MGSRPCLIAAALLYFFTVPSPAGASTGGEFFPSHTWTIGEATAVDAHTEGRRERQWHVTFEPPVTEADRSRLDAIDRPATADNQRPVAFDYSDGYNTRRKIHLIASYATTPLFVAQYIAGDKLFDNTGGSTARSAHGALTAGIAALFAVNTVTGVWNLLEGRKDPNGGARRWIHGLLMLGADAGFVATGAMAPDDDERGGADRSAHRNVAIASMGVAAASYIYMLVAR